VRLALVGATGGIGRSVLQAASADGHLIKALSRDRSRLAALDPSRVAVIEGDVRDAQVAAEIVTGVDAVICALGVQANVPTEADAAESAMRVIVEARMSAGVERLVALSGAAVTLPGEAKPLSGRVAARVVGLAARWVVEAKRREASIILDSELDWTLVRPPNVVPGPPDPSIGLRLSLPGRSFRVTQGDVAAALVRCAGERIFVRQAPFVG
jgi:uncharacterized protein YbjT (DUF2867 family)